MKPHKLPSGKWRIQIYDYTDEQGKQHKKSFTHSDKKELLRIVAEYQIKKEHIRDNNFTWKEASDAYIESKSAVLSPSSIRGYRAIQKRIDWDNRVITSITNDFLQDYINELSAKYSPKTVRNAYGFINAVLNKYEIYPKNITLPKKVKTTSIFLLMRKSRQF